MEFRSQPLRQSPHFRFRTAATALVLACGLSVLGMRVAYLTVVKGKHYAAAADANLESTRRLEAPRGNILDHEGRPVAFNRKAWSISFSRHGKSAEQVHECLRGLSDLTGEDMLSRYEEIMATKPSWTRISLARRLPQETIVPILERPDDFPGVRLETDYRREYPAGTAMAIVVGYLGRIPEGAESRYTKPLYLPDAFVGRAGIESHYEARLTGKAGRERLTRDARGQQLAEPVVEIPAAAGDDLVLSVDSELQRFAFDALGGQDGSVILMEAQTGALRVMASSPSFLPDQPWVQEIDGHPVSFLNRAAQSSYPPGSTFKIVTAAAGLAHGLQSTDTIRCDGNYQLGDWARPYWCDQRSGHGAVDLEESLQKSCNVYYYELGHRVGAADLMAKAREFGFTTRTGIDLPGEKSGQMTRGDELPPDGELLNLAIGQGAFLATPLQVAVAYAALANGGTRVEPRLVQEIHEAGDPDHSQNNLSPASATVSIPHSERETLTAGLYAAVNETGGTAVRAAFDPAWQVCGKTGTAENGKGGVDAWFAGYFPRNNPEYVLVVQVEQAAGHGGDIAGPIARDVIHRLKNGAPIETESLVMASDTQTP